MSIALCMLVKDEINRIERCLEPICRLVDEIVIIDTGSTDGTPELIESRFGIRPQHGRLSEERCLTKIDLRNQAFAQVQTDWILSLDADERMDPAGLAAFREMRHDPGTSGYFGLWRNHVGDDPAFDDYKCFLFRRGHQARGLVHENVQVDIRDKGGRALWLDAIVVDHHPEYIKHAGKTQLYYRRLVAALRMHPDWPRYNWFLGYLQSQLGELDEAIGNLSRCFESGSRLFPVERLNSAMVLADILCRRQEGERALALLREADALFRQVESDFEVAINGRMGPWIRESLESLRAGRPDAVKAYRFAR